MRKGAPVFARAGADDALEVGAQGHRGAEAGPGRDRFDYAGVASYVAYRGLVSYRCIGLGWIMHTVWDVAHHFYGQPIVFFAPTSSAQCAITDALIAVWFFAGAPSAYDAVGLSARRAAARARS